jgi:hypothetical protein
MASPLLVVIDKINVKSLAVLESTNNSPIGADCHSPKASELALYFYEGEAVAERIIDQLRPASSTY